MAMPRRSRGAEGRRKKSVAGVYSRQWILQAFAGTYMRRVA